MRLFFTLLSALCIIGMHGQTFYLDFNGVTIKCIDCEPGDTGVVLGTTYTAVDNTMLEAMADDHENQDLSAVCTTLVTEMISLFRFESNFNQDISSWDMSNVLNTYQMLQGANAFNQDVTSWDVGNVEYFERMFDQLEGFNQDISSWDVSSAISLQSMLSYTDFNQDISGWDVSNVERFQGVFSLTAFNQDISSWDVSSGLYFGSMFSSSPFNQDISSWDMSSAESLFFMFGYNDVFNQDISSWDVSNVETMTSVFYSSDAFNQDISSWNTSSVTRTDNMFQEATSFNQGLNSWDMSSCTNLNSMFKDATAFNGDITEWQFHPTEGVYLFNMFEGATAFNQDIGNWSFIQGGYWAFPCGMESMFENAISFNQDLSCWCVPLCDSEPLDFSTGCPIEDSNQPQWGTCPTEGCTDSGACNYDSEAGCDDGSCEYITPVNLGEDIETCEESVTLDAGPGYGSYLWSTGDNTQSIYASTTGNYSVTVGDSVGVDNDYSMSFDGVDDYVSCYNPVIPSSGDFSVSVWAKLSEISTYYSEIVSQGISGQANFYIGYKPNTGELRFGDDWQNTDLYYPADDEWHHFAVIKSSSETYFYLDGILAASLGSAIGNPTAEPFTIGSSILGLEASEFFNGEIDEVSVWDIALSGTEVNSYMDCPLSGNEEGLVGYWNF
ncbi:MAG: BspA family leucine-rich repeat surface protein, partial [Flavobacteriales bacterium]